MSLSIDSTVRLRSGACMPRLGLGVFNVSDTRTACLASFRHGYRLVDSAQAYENEAGVGQAVKESGLEREVLFISTKIKSPDHGYESTLAGVDASLARFGLEYLDLFLVHDPLAGPQKRLETYKALLECRDQGKIRSVGVSNFGIKHLEQLKEAGYETPVVNQLEVHPWCQQKETIAYCQERSIIVEAYCPLVRNTKSEHPVLKELSLKYGVSPVQILIRWSLQMGYVPIPGADREEWIAQNAEVYKFELSDEDMARFDALDEDAAGALSWNPINAP